MQGVFWHFEYGLSLSRAVGREFSAVVPGLSPEYPPSRAALQSQFAAVDADLPARRPFTQVPNLSPECSAPPDQVGTSSGRLYNLNSLH